MNGTVLLKAEDFAIFTSNESLMQNHIKSMAKQGIEFWLKGKIKELVSVIPLLCKKKGTETFSALIKTASALVAMLGGGGWEMIFCGKVLAL